jgi:homoserine dehydrogenase
MKTVKVAMLGMGTVNRTLLKILSTKKDRLAEDYGIVFKVLAATDSTGIIVDDNGLDFLTLVDHKETGGGLSDLLSFKGCQVENVINSLDLDLLFEATPVHLETGGEALNICRRALKNGISVVLANKGPLVHGIGELLEIAKLSGAGLEYSATVCGGLPILNIGTRDMIAGDIKLIRGVFNGTSNFIIDAMSEGFTFDEGIEKARAVGAAEADPSLDTGGWDTAFKLLILANTVMGVNIKLSDISVEGIDNITSKKIQKAKELGKTIKLVASVEGGKFNVKPIAEQRDSFLGSINGWEMGVEIHSDIYGISYHKLYEKEPIPTAASMMRDAVNIFKDK